MKWVFKRDGIRKKKFNRTNIEEAIQAAFISVDGDLSSEAIDISKNISLAIEELPQTKFKVDEIQDLIEQHLMNCKRKDVAKAYIRYRMERDRLRANSFDATVEEIVTNSSDYWSNENSNKDARIASTQRDYIAGAVSTDLSRRKYLPQDVVEAHNNGEIHFHK